MPVPSVSALIPIRKGSERIADKNIRTFSGIEGGLTRIKIGQLLECSDVSEIVISTNDERIPELLETVSDERVRIDWRPEELCLSSTETDTLIDYAIDIIQGERLLWTHVTSPFVTAVLYQKALSLYDELVLDKKYDSLMSVLPLKNFLWSAEGPLNYSTKDLKWPRTQTLPEWYEVTSGFFLADVVTCKRYRDRIGKKPFLFEVDPIHAIDIDDPSQFEYAEKMWAIINKKEA